MSWSLAPRWNAVPWHTRRAGIRRWLRIVLSVAVSMVGIALPASSAVAGVTVHVLARGAALHGSNGISFDRHDQLWIASVLSNELIAMDPRTGMVHQRIGPDRGVAGPDDVTFGPDGSLFWTEIASGKVGRLRPDGSMTTIAQLPGGANAITLSADGRLFVSLALSGVDALYEVDPDGIMAPRLIAQNLGNLNAFDFGADGFLYGPLVDHARVVRIDVDSGAITPVADGFNTPVAAKFDSRGRLHVADLGDGTIYQVDTSTGAKRVIAQLTPGLDNMAFDSSDRLFVSSAFNGTIVEVRRDQAARVVSSGGRVVSPGGMIAPGGVAVLPGADGAGRVFVADFWSLRQFNGRTGAAGDVAYHNFVGDGVKTPMTVAPYGENLLLTSWLSNVVQIWDPRARSVVAQFADFAVPLNAIGFQGDIVVAELATGQLVRAEGTDPSVRSTIASGLNVPTGLAATNDDLFVAEFATGRILQIVSDGRALTTPRVVTSGLVSPEGLAVDRDGSLLVVDVGTKRLIRVDSVTGETSTVADGLAVGLPAVPGPPIPEWTLSGVAVDPSGAIYVTGDVDNVLYRIRSPAVDRGCGCRWG
jgi:sugar lactone lactonase YvrE